jgi:hypothetical protein
VGGAPEGGPEGAQRKLYAQGWGNSVHEAAEEMNRRALLGHEKVLGVEHMDTLTSPWCLAFLLHQRKQYSPACNLYHRAYQGFEKSLGYDHLKTVQSHQPYPNAMLESGVKINK